MLRPRAPAFRFAPSHAHRATVPRRRRADLLSATVTNRDDGGSVARGSDSSHHDRRDHAHHRGSERIDQDHEGHEDEDEVSRALRALAPRVRVPRLVNARTRRRANAFAARRAETAVRARGMREEEMKVHVFIFEKIFFVFVFCKYIVAFVLKLLSLCALFFVFLF